MAVFCCAHRSHSLPSFTCFGLQLHPQLHPEKFFKIVSFRVSPRVSAWRRCLSVCLHNVLTLNRLRKTKPIDGVKKYAIIPSTKGEIEMSAKKEKLEGSDRRYGWRFGEKDFVNATQAAEMLGISTNHMCRLLKELEQLTVKKPTDRTWPLRAGKLEIASDAKNAQWRVCVRSVNEYAKRRQPVEV